jgi:hypothetical protein
MPLLLSLGPATGILAPAGEELHHGREHDMPKSIPAPSAAASRDELDAKVVHAELQARYLEAQVRVLEARKRLAELRRSMKGLA